MLMQIPESDTNNPEADSRENGSPGFKPVLKRLLKNVISAFAGITMFFVSTGFPEDDTWANWVRKWDVAFANIPSRAMPGRTMGIIVPSDTRDDLLPMSAFGYEVLGRASFSTAIILMQAPDDVTSEGFTLPAVDTLESTIGRFQVDAGLRAQLMASGQHVTVDPNLFLLGVPKILDRQLAALKYVLRKDALSLRILPVYVRMADINSGIKDLAPFLVDRIREIGVDSDVMLIALANLTKAGSEERLIEIDSTLLKAVRELDVETALNLDKKDVANDDFGTLLLSVLTMRWMGSDHADILSYSHSGQMVLTKDKKNPLSYLAAGFASRPATFPKVAHVQQEKMAGIFGELLRSDLLALARQTFLSTIDPTAAKPPAVNNAQAAKKWPVYISVYDANGKLAGQAGTHIARAPLEESIRKFTFEATRNAQPPVPKTAAGSHVIEISIPYGFEKINRPDDYIPLLNGVVVEQKLKTQALHPDAWRKYPDPHQLLSAISTRLGSDPWAYATGISKLDSFRVFSFNEKEPFQELTPSKKKKKKNTDDGGDSFDSGGGGGGSGGAFGF